MIRSDHRILTTHSGSLPRPDALVGLLNAKDAGRSFDAAEFDRQVCRSVRDVVQRQVDVGIDVVDDGEHSKSSFHAYTVTRLSGFELSGKPAALRSPTRDVLAFPEVYREQAAMFAARPLRAAQPKIAILPLVCTGPIRYIGHKEVQADIDRLKAGLEGRAAEEAFVTAISPTNLELYYRNEYYPTREEYLVALADAMREEYRAVVDAGLVLQIDDPRLATHYGRVPNATLEECRRFIAESVEILNHALDGLPEDRVRFHTCYSVNVAPRVHEMELKNYVDLMLKIRVGAYSFEAANPRHEHEWKLWEDVRLPAGKILIPGVVSHCVYLVEHPELVAQRIIRLSRLVGRENVIAGTDCGFATSAAGDEVHPDVAWAKLAALTEGARLASRTLWGNSLE